MGRLFYVKVVKVSSMEGISDIYNKLGGTISQDEFEQKVQDKIVEMNGLCDERSAAMLVANDLGYSEVSKDINKIKDITPELKNAIFTAKVLSASDVREFDRNDGSIGKVGNLLVGDETGTIKITLWDERAELIRTGDIETGKCYNFEGYVKEGFSGPEVNLGSRNGLSESDEDVVVSLNYNAIANIKDGMNDINLAARILDIADVRTFQNKKGGTGKVCNITIGDETGKIRMTLWNEKVELLEGLEVDDNIEIVGGYSKVNNFNDQVEVQVGNNSSIRKTDKEVDYYEQFTPIADIIPGESYSIQGEVSGIGEFKEFTRDDGSANMVSNIYISDETGRIRVSLWGEHATIVDEIDIESPIQIMDAYAKTGFNDDIELSAGNRTRIKIPGE